MLRLAKYSIGAGDRFAHQAAPQLEACIEAIHSGIEVVPVWNKSYREHSIVGSLPPSARIAAYSRSVRRPCFLTDGRRIVLPAFGAFTGGLNVRDPAFAGLFAEPPMAAALGRDRVHALAWGSLLG